MWVEPMVKLLCSRRDNQGMYIASVTPYMTMTQIVTKNVNAQPRLALILSSGKPQRVMTHFFGFLRGSSRRLQLVDIFPNDEHLQVAN